MGAANILVIPVWFTDSGNYISTGKKDAIKADIETAYFGTNEETGWRSVKSFYEEESHGALTLTGTVSGWYSAGNNSSYYGQDDGYVTKTTTLVRNATDWYFNTYNTSDKRKNYDKDGDGFIDSVMLIYAAPDHQALGNKNLDNLWAYCYWLGGTSSTRNPNPNVFFWASYDFMYSSNKATERTGKTNYANGDTTHCTIDAHTYIHEMGHVFGLEDYYDYSGKYSPAAGFSMQDNNVGGHDPFSSYALGWGSAYIPTETTTIDLKPFAETGEMILLSPNPNAYNSPFDEYLLLEYYTPTGLNKMDCDYQYGGRYPQGPKERGIRLWHVDARLAVNKQIISNPPDGSNYNIQMAMSNTDYSNDVSSGYLSPLGNGNYDYNILQLIRNDRYTDYKPNTDLTSSNLYKSGSFNIDKVKKQFVNQGKFNNGNDIGFTFTINALDEYRASITVTKL